MKFIIPILILLASCNTLSTSELEEEVTICIYEGVRNDCYEKLEKRWDAEDRRRNRDNDSICHGKQYMFCTSSGTFMTCNCIYK